VLAGAQSTRRQAMAGYLIVVSISDVPSG
jgi:hypothetical protein